MSPAYQVPLLPSPPPAPQAGERWALLLDVDGTLLDFALRPDMVRVELPLVEHLRLLHRELDGALALVSGRGVTDLERLFAPLDLNYIGLHGLERKLRGMEIEHFWDDEPERIRHLYEEAERAATRLPGVHVERKGPCVALHCREAPRQMPAMLEAAQVLAERFEGYGLLRGYEVCEIKPAQADKGMAVAALMRRSPFAGRRMVYLGDDHTDEPALQVARESDGLAIAVGARVSQSATHALAYPQAVRSWLADLVRTMERQGAS